MYIDRDQTCRLNRAIVPTLITRPFD